jgi:hypothetical protein
VKPLACTLEDANAILRAAKANQRILVMGHQERSILNRLYLDAHETPQLIKCHRLNPWTSRVIGVDIALNLMVRNLDLVLQLVPRTGIMSSTSG